MPGVMDYRAHMQGQGLVILHVLRKAAWTAPYGHFEQVPPTSCVRPNTLAKELETSSSLERSNEPSSFVGIAFGRPDRLEML